MANDAKCPVVKITNNSSYAVDIYDVFNPSKQGEKLPHVYTKLDTLAVGESKSIQTIHTASKLEAAYTGTIEKLNKFYFHQFPIKVMAAVQFTFKSPPPLEFTITTDDENAMIQSFLFHRYAMANPNSALTKNLYTALKTGKVSGVNSFFAGTKNFQNCTMASWNAILEWLQMSTSGWQGPFYLYEKAPSPIPKGYVPTLVATMNIVSSATENSATMKMCTQDAKGNPIYAPNTQPTTIIMNGDGTMGDSDPGNDVSVTLTPVWMNVIQTQMKDGKPVTNYISGPTVTGTIANKEVVSTQTARQIPDKPASKKKKPATSGNTFGTICQSVGLLVGLLMLGDFAKKMFSSAKDKVKELKEKASSKEEFDQEMQDNNPDNAPDPEVVDAATQSESTFTDSATEVGDAYSATSEAQQKDVLSDTIDETANTVQEEIEQQLENGLTPTEDYENAVNDMNESFQKAETNIEDGNISAASEELNTASENMQKAIENGEHEMADWEKDSLSESSDAVSEASESQDELDTAQDEYDDEMTDEENDSGFDETEDSEWPEVEEMAEV